MQSRMDKYNNNGSVSSRVERNKSLYEEVKNSSIEDFNVDSNVSVIGRNSSNIDMGNLRNILDTKYADDTPKRRSIALDYQTEDVEKKPLQDTKEYDINVILRKAKEGKDVNYNKERLKSVRQTQYEILNNLDLSAPKEPDAYETKKKADEDNLMELINTITALELKNKGKVDQEVSQALDLFDDLSESTPEDKEVEKVVFKEQPKDIVEEKTQEEIIKEEENKRVILEKLEETEEEHNEHVEETLSKLNIDMDSYDDFNDVEKPSKTAFILKVMIFLIIILLIIGAVFIINDMLDLGIFN